MSRKKDFEGLDFHPQGFNTKRPLCVTIGQQAQLFLDSLVQFENVNVSKFVDALLCMVDYQKGVTNPITYANEGGKYRYCNLLLREEVADFLEAWILNGITGNAAINNPIIEPSTPFQIAEKLSFSIVDNPEIMSCDRNIYGYNTMAMQAKYNRAADLARQTPDKQGS